MDLSMLKFDDKGLIPVITQDCQSGAVFMQAYMNKEALELTIKTGRATYYSRSRQSLWIKGETSGNVQTVKSIAYDCDADSILMQVDQTGVACHTGEYSCYHNELFKTDDDSIKADASIISELYGVVQDRLNNPKEGSYTNYLLEKGVDKISKKVVEEACEVIIGAKNKDKNEMQYEIADLLYHLIVLMVDSGVKLEDVFSELQGRR